MVSAENNARIEARLHDLAGVEEAIRQAQEIVIRRHVATGRKIPRWRDDRVEWVDARIVLQEAGFSSLAISTPWAGQDEE